MALLEPRSGLAALSAALSATSNALSSAPPVLPAVPFLWPQLLARFKVSREACCYVIFRPFCSCGLSCLRASSPAHKRTEYLLGLSSITSLFCSQHAPAMVVCMQCIATPCALSHCSIHDSPVVCRKYQNKLLSVLHHLPFKA